MLTVLLPYPGFIAIGLLWQRLKFLDMPAASLRRVLNAVIFSFMLPAFTLPYLWQAQLSMNLLKTMSLMLAAILLGFGFAWLWLKRKRWGTPTKGALLLAVGFPAVFALGLPLMGHTTGMWAQRLAVESGALIMLPLLFSLGSIFAQRMGDVSKGPLPPGLMLHKMPMTWAVVVGLALNLLQMKPPTGLTLWLQHLSASMLPLMLIVVGASLRWNKNWFRLLPKLLPVFLISLLLMPTLLWLGAWLGGLNMPKTMNSLILLAGLPATTLGFNLCERYRLDIVAYNIAYTAMLILSLLTISGWLYLMHTGLLPR